jgi:cytochrome c peroxidase
LAQNPNQKDSYETYSCATCHIPEKGFLPGRIQGIADGGRGFGDNGSFRTIAPTYLEEEVDAQGNRPLTVMNVTFSTNTLGVELLEQMIKTLVLRSIGKGLQK